MGQGNGDDNQSRRGTEVENAIKRTHDKASAMEQNVKEELMLHAVTELKEKALLMI